MARTKKETIKVVVTPATDNAHKERFVKVNGKVIAFGVPMELTQDDINAIKRLKEPKKSSTGVDVHDIMDQLQITQEKANKILRQNKDMQNNVNIRYVNKYNISKV